MFRRWRLGEEITVGIKRQTREETKHKENNTHRDEIRDYAGYLVSLYTGI
jgi:hypothetical protein